MLPALNRWSRFSVCRTEADVRDGPVSSKMKAGLATLSLRYGGLSILSLIGFLITATAVPATDRPPAAMTNHDWEATWTKVLGRHVDDVGRIDFAGLAADRSDLDRVVAFAAAVDPRSAPDRFPTRDSRLAYYINIYNARP
jgi:hypothetical protein